MLKVVEWFKRGSASQKAIGGFVEREKPTAGNAACTALGWMEPVILDFRNRALAQRIMQSPNDRIFIANGVAHLPGLVAELRKLDPKWAVGSVKWLRTIEAPEHIEGQLRGLGN